MGNHRRHLCKRRNIYPRQHAITGNVGEDKSFCAYLCHAGHKRGCQLPDMLLPAFYRHFPLACVHANRYFFAVHRKQSFCELGIFGCRRPNHHSRHPDIEHPFDNLPASDSAAKLHGKPNLTDNLTDNIQVLGVWQSHPRSIEVYQVEPACALLFPPFGDLHGVFRVGCHLRKLALT